MAGKNPYFAFKQFRVEQDQSAMKVTTDACILGALFGQSPHLKSSRSVLDIGAGTGLLSLMAAQNSSARITAIELDGEASKQAEHNFAQSQWADQLHLINSSIQSFSATSEQRFDCIISNPPFFQQAFKGSDHRRNMARHTDSLSFTELADSIYRLLAKDGEAWMILPVTSSAAFLAATTRGGLRLHRRISLLSTGNHSPHRYILVLKHGSSLKGKALLAEAMVIEEILTIYQKHPHYTEAIKQLMAPYYLAL